MKTMSPALLPISLIALLLSGCSGSGTSSKKPINTTVPPANISGVVGASNIYNALMYAVPTDVQGQPAFNAEGTEYVGGKTTSNLQAAYRTQVEGIYVGKPALFIANFQAADAVNSTPITTQNCEVVAGCFPAVGFNTAVELDADFKLTAAIGNVQNGMRVNVNWITTLAADIAYTSYIDAVGTEGPAPTTAKPGMYTPYTIERGNLWLSKQLDLPDVISITPIAPSKLNDYPQLDSNIREQGIRYGALLAAGQALAGEANQTEAKWVQDVVAQQRDLQNQLYQNQTGEFSLCGLYTAATTVLEANITATTAVPSEANAVVTYLAGKKTAYCAANNGYETAIEVDFSEIKGWVNIAQNAKDFVKDLNERLINIKADQPNTCTQWNSDPTAGCIDSFFDPLYTARTKTYYEQISEFTKTTNDTELKQAFTDLRDGILDFIRCIQDKTPCVSANYKKDADKHTYTKGSLTLTLEPDATIKEGDKFFAFNFVLAGTQALSGGTGSTGSLIKYENFTPAGKDAKVQTPRVRIVYNEAYELPPLTATAAEATPTQMPTAADGVEPLGFDFYFPKLVITNVAGKTLESRLAFKMIGVKPYDFTSSLFELPYHYNITEASLVTSAEGAVVGTIPTADGTGTEDAKDKVTLNFSTQSTNAANYYATHVWPNVRDMFTPVAGGGAEAPSDPQFDEIADLFTYVLLQDQTVVSYYECVGGKYNTEGTCSSGTTHPVEVQADYFQIETKGLGINRYELFDVTQNNRTYQLLRNCVVSYVENSTTEIDESKKVCAAGQEVSGKPDADGKPQKFSLLTDLLVKKDDKYTYFSLFSLPGYGAYEPEFPATMGWAASPETIKGVRKAQFSQGLSDFSLLIDQRFINTDGNGKSTRAPLAIAKFNLKKQTPTSWEVAFSAGYDYQYLVGPYPVGEKAQSLYLSYFVNETTDGNDTRLVTELGGLTVLRGATSAFGASKSNGITIGSRLGYEVDATAANNTLLNGCGYTGNNQAVKECNAVAYLAFRSALLAVVREERSGVYVARFSDGDFVILGTL